MKIGIIGLPGSGKSTVFEALTRNISEAGFKGEDRIATIQVPDKRVSMLNDIYQRKKNIYARIEYFLPGMMGQKKDHNIWNRVRDCDALLNVVRNFSGYGLQPPTPHSDILDLDQELILADLMAVENRLERLEKKRGKEIDHEEVALLNECRKNLENERPIRKFSDLSAAPSLKGFAFVSAKPMLILFNNDDEDNHIPEGEDLVSELNCMVIRGKLEQELAQMTDEEVEDFLAEFGISASAKDRVIKESYEYLGVISFFTVEGDEVKAWTVKKDTRAVDAAGVIHSDMERGFIRAEVIAFDDLMDAGTYPEARKKGTVRLEGKTYAVQDGDVIKFRFNV
ncbi:DUF933 domain-containing protein [Thermodesulfobacteriota bacterium]